MTQDDGVPSHYPCLTQKDGLRRVREPQDERRVVRQRPLLRRLEQLVLALRR